MGRRRQHHAARLAARPPRPTGATRHRELLERGPGRAPTLPQDTARPHRDRGVSRAGTVTPLRDGRPAPALALLETERRAGRGSGGMRRSGGRAAPAAAPEQRGSDGVDAIVREAAGNPFLVEQLVHYIALLAPAGGAAAATSGVSLGDVLEARLAQLPRGARTLLETLALAGQPLDATVARDVAGFTEDERQLVALLQAERWLKDTRTAERLELYHDGI